MTENIGAEEGLLLVLYPEIDARLGLATDLSGFDAWEEGKHIADGLMSGIFSEIAVPVSGLTAEAETNNDVAIVSVRGSSYGVTRSYQPQAARALNAYGLMALKGASDVTDTPNAELQTAKDSFETALSLLSPFVNRERGYRLGSQMLIRLPSEDIFVRTNTHRQYERIKTDLANTLSYIGRVGSIEGSRLNEACLEEAHRLFAAGPDRVGRLRNALYLLIAERSRADRFGRVSHLAGRAAWALSLASTVRWQRKAAWKTAASMVGHVLTAERAIAARGNRRVI